MSGRRDSREVHVGITSKMGSPWPRSAQVKSAELDIQRPLFKFCVCLVGCMTSGKFLSLKISFFTCEKRIIAFVYSGYPEGVGASKDITVLKQI